MTLRIRLFSAIVAACLALAVGYTWYSLARSGALYSDASLPPLEPMRGTVSEPSDEPDKAEPGDTVVLEETRGDSTGIAIAAPERADPRTQKEVAGGAEEPSVSTVFVRHTGLDSSYGVMAVDASDGRSDVRRATEFRCDRLYFAVDRGVCMTTSRFYTTQSLIIFDEQFVELHRLHLNGLPTRARVSPDGRRAATTVFLTGHSYAGGDFSTESSIIDTDTGEVIIETLQTLPAFLDDQRINAIDVNVWGVTFAPDSDRFYATYATGGHTYLVEGSISDRRLRVLRDGVECPSLSPDGRRIAFKKRVPGMSGVWRLHVMDIDTLDAWPVAEVRSVDDQAEWIDNDTLAYALPREGGPAAVNDVWSVAADGAGLPALLFEDAASPSVVRAGYWASFD